MHSDERQRESLRADAGILLTVLRHRLDADVAYATQAMQARQLVRKLSMLAHLEQHMAAEAAQE